jgi:DNA-binding winged helix-turn-helix (wHTH) protein
MPRQPNPDMICETDHLDTANERLWRGTHELSLRPKTFAVLRYLVEHPGRLINREELLKAVWAPTHVSEAMPKLYIREIRQALGDDPHKPQFIETIPRRGWRFIAPITTASPVASAKWQVPSFQTTPTPGTQHLP